MLRSVEDLETWSGFVAYVQAHYREVEVFPGDRLRFTYDDRGTAFAIGAQLLRAVTGTAWLGIATKLGPVDKLRERSALVANIDLPIGGFAIVLDQAVLRQTLPLHGLRPAQLSHALHALAELTAQLRHAATMDDADIDTPYAFVFH